MARRPDRKTTWISIVLVIAIAAPAIVLGLTVAPWFFLILVGLVVVPFLFLRRSVPEAQRARAR
jgi:hypothetical protein